MVICCNNSSVLDFANSVCISPVSCRNGKAISLEDKLCIVKEKKNEYGER